MRLPRFFRWLSATLALVCYSGCETGLERSVTGHLVGAKSTGESVPAAVATVAFRNDSANAADIQSYRLTWPGGTFSAEPKDLRIPPHSQIERTARVDPRAGDIAALIDRPHQVTIELVWARSRAGARVVGNK